MYACSIIYLFIGNLYYTSQKYCQICHATSLITQQQQNFSPKLRCLCLAMMKFIEHAVSQAKRLNQLVHIASWSAIAVFISLRLQWFLSGWR